MEKIWNHSWMCRFIWYRHREDCTPFLLPTPLPLFLASLGYPLSPKNHHVTSLLSEGTALCECWACYHCFQVPWHFFNEWSWFQCNRAILLSTTAFSLFSCIVFSLLLFYVFKDFFSSSCSSERMFFLNPHLKRIMNHWEEALLLIRVVFFPLHLGEIKWLKYKFDLNGS